uniref:Uncharacterized protein n=1 Tax=Coccolithus braarudii TaxID=221442 RepID=A0A7S0Q3J2_9EUKA|mmetsp:Transcript_30858/g.66294  ORF Transcript_30858/g.66294 Transcript_30858/m.66294 type:complete len:380 (+) Transcript_30858:126-1265(+)
MQCFLAIAVATASGCSANTAVPRLATPVSRSNHHFLVLRGGASNEMAAKDEQQQEPSLSAVFVAGVLGFAVLPTLLRLAYALATRSAVETAPTSPSLMQSLGMFTAAPSMPKLPPLPYPAVWQVLLAAAWVMNNIAVVVPGRYDGRSVMTSEKPTAAGANLFTPAGYAFIIWAPIFLGEGLMMLYLTNVQTPLGAAVAPAWCAAALAQSCWCAAFRPSVCGPRLLWVPALLLASTGAALGVAHRAIRTANVGALANCLVRVPVTLHFGWITAAALVNANNYLARTVASVRAKEAAAHASSLAAVAAVAYVSHTTADHVFAGVIAWALGWVAVDGSRAARGLLPEAPLDRVQWSARIGGALAAVLALLLALGLGAFGKRV